MLSHSTLHLEVTSKHDPPILSPFYKPFQPHLNLIHFLYFQIACKHTLINLPSFLPSSTHGFNLSQHQQQQQHQQP